MLMTDMPPCKNYTAGIVLNILCGFLLDAGHSVCCFATTSEYLPHAPEIPEDKISRMKFAYATMPRENHGHRAPHFLSSFIGNNRAALFDIPPIAKKIAAFSKENKVDFIWSIVQGQTTIRLASRVVRITKLPYAVHIWDPPGWWLRGNRFDKITTKWVLNKFEKIVRKSSCCISASWAMSEEYIRRYRCKKSVPVILGFEPRRVEPQEDKNHNCFVIAFSGQSYASEELNCLIVALCTLGWQHEGKDVVLRLYGREFQLTFAKDARIEMRGWVPYEQMIIELAGADLLYCPYWFTAVFEEEARLSFPSKLTTYFKTAVPVLFHGPAYSSPRQFIEKNGCSYIADSLDSEVMAETLRFILTDRNRATMGEKGYQAFLKHLTLDKMRENFFEALSIK